MPSESSDFRFPDTQFVPNMCGDNQTYCEQVDNYPLDMINDVVERQGHRYSALFGDDIIKMVEPSLDSRINILEESTMCDSTSSVIYPKTAKTKDNVWLFIVNSDKFKQGVVIEKCT